jgi:hypothetical protein
MVCGVRVLATDSPAPHYIDPTNGLSRRRLIRVLIHLGSISGPGMIGSWAYHQQISLLKSSFGLLTFTNAKPCMEIVLSFMQRVSCCIFIKARVYMTLFYSFIMASYGVGEFLHSETSRNYWDVVCY